MRLIGKRPPIAALFRGLRYSAQQAFCRSVYTLALLATIVFSEIGIPAAHENSPGLRRGQSQAEAVMRNDRNPFSGVQVKGYRPPSVPRSQRGARTFKIERGRQCLPYDGIKSYTAFWAVLSLFRQ